MIKWNDNLHRKRNFIDLAPMQSLKIERKTMDGLWVNEMLIRYEFNNGIHHNNDFATSYLLWRLLDVAVENACKNIMIGSIQDNPTHFQGLQARLTL